MSRAARRGPNRTSRQRVARALSLVTLAFVALALRARAQAPLTLVLGGDVIFDAPIEYALRRTDRPRDDAASYAPIFEDLAPVLRSASLAVVNLETPIAQRTLRSEEGEPPRFAAPRAFLAAIADAGVDAVTVANNHAYDQGVAGLGETLAALADQHLLAIGGGDRPHGAVHTSLAGHRVALLAFSEGTNWRVRDEEAATPRIAMLDEEALRREVSAAREGAAFVAVAFHWGEGRDHVPSPRMLRHARIAANAGADLIYGHGTHLPERTSVLRAESGREVPVIWSLGNLVAVMNTTDDEVFSREPSVRESWLATVRLRASGGRLDVASIEASPFWIGVSEREGTPPFVRPLALALEREALASLDCGARCRRLEAAYAARERRAHAVLGMDRASRVADVPSEESASIADEARPELADDPRAAGEAEARTEAARLAREAEAAREAETARVARDAEAARVARDAEAARVAEAARAAEAARVAREVEAARVARDAEAREAEAARAAREAERAREAEAARVAREAADRGRVAAREAEARSDARDADGERADEARPRRSRRVAVDLGGIATARLRVTFEGERAIESEIDRAQLEEIVAAMRADGTLYLEVIGHPAGPEDRALWARRAARARGLIAIRGPSRSRITSRAGVPAPTPHLEIVLSR